jgi:hypothetical protein
VVPDFLSTSGLLDTRTSSSSEEEEGREDGGHEGLRVVYLAQGWLDAKNVHYALISGTQTPYVLPPFFFAFSFTPPPNKTRKSPEFLTLASSRLSTLAATDRSELYTWGRCAALRLPFSRRLLAPS